MALGITGILNLAMMAYSLYQKNQSLNIAKDASSAGEVETSISGGKETDADRLASEDKLGDQGADFLKSADSKSKGAGLGFGANSMATL